MVKSQSPAINYVALYDYVAKCDDDLSFVKGELLEIIHDGSEVDEVDNWWYVKSQTTKKEGYVPSNYITNPANLVSKDSGFRYLSHLDSKM